MKTNSVMQYKEVKFLIIHCSATRCDQDYTVERMRKDHQARGFRDIGYHFYVRKDGTISQHRKLLEVGAHCKPYNRCSIGICYEGGLNQFGIPANTLTEIQEECLEALLIRLHDFFPNAKIVGHRDLPKVAPKACPCLNTKEMFGWIEKIKTFGWIDELKAVDWSKEK